MENEPGIYYILNLHNNRMYIGQSERMCDRLKQHTQALRSHRHDIADLQTDWDIHGEQSFEFGVLVTILPWGKRFRANQIGQIERIFIRIYQSENPTYGYNTNQKAKGRKAQDLVQRLHGEANEAARKYRPN